MILCYCITNTSTVSKKEKKYSISLRAIPN